MQFGSVEAVVAAIREDAKAETEKIDRDFSAAEARLWDEDAALPIVVADAEPRIAAARRAVRDRFATEDWADHQAALGGREAWIRQVVAESERRLDALANRDSRADLVELVREAVERMPDEPLELLVPAVHVDPVKTMLDRGLFASSSRAITGVRETGEISSGCIAQTMDGRIRYENSYGMRAKRFEPTWRARLGELYEIGEPVLPGAGARRSDA